MPIKTNIVLDEDVKAGLDTLVKSGKRSRVINTALLKELLLPCITRRALALAVPHVFLERRFRQWAPSFPVLS